MRRRAAVAGVVALQPLQRAARQGQGRLLVGRSGLNSNFYELIKNFKLTRI
jgi:hypothetical protein